MGELHSQQNAQSSAELHSKQDAEHHSQFAAQLHSELPAQLHSELPAQFNAQHLSSAYIGLWCPWCMLHEHLHCWRLCLIVTFSAQPSGGVWVTRRVDSWK